MLLNYTWSHCISDGDASSEIGGGYQDPNDRQRRARQLRCRCAADFQWLFRRSDSKFASPWTRRLFGKWETSAIVTKRTGFWFNTGTGRDKSLTGVSADRPDVIADSRRQ